MSERCQSPQAHPARCGCGEARETDLRNALRTANEHTRLLLAERDALQSRLDAAESEARHLRKGLEEWKAAANRWLEDWRVAVAENESAAHKLAERDAVLRECRSRVEGMQAIQGRAGHFGHSQLLERIDALLSSAEPVNVEAGRGPTPACQGAPVCGMGVGCDEAGICFAVAHGEPDRCGMAAESAPSADSPTVKPDQKGTIRND